MDTAASWEARWERADKRRAQTAKRRPPMPTITNGAGTCRWCAGEIRYPEGHKRAGEINTRSGWHKDCLGWFYIATRGSDQRCAIKPPHDGRPCALCREPIGDQRVFIAWQKRYDTMVIDGFAKKAWRGPATVIEAIFGQPWQADHIVPLWSIRDAGLEARGCHFGLVNLWALCPACHTAKTKREAKARSIMRTAA